jgi:hypothetical protein
VSGWLYEKPASTGASGVASIEAASAGAASAGAAVVGSSSPASQARRMGVMGALSAKPYSVTGGL